MKLYSAAWFERQAAHAREILAEADRIHTPEEIAAARAALAMAPSDPQPELDLTTARQERQAS
jgi:hypothetical protein